MSYIKRAVSLYSLQDEYARKKLSLEQIFQELVAMGVEGFEFISDQMLHQSPCPTEETLKEWDRLMAKYPLKPVCNDVFINTTLYKNRVLTKQESVDCLIKEIKLANRLGFKLIRLVSMTPPEIIEPALPYAEKYDVTLALEIHAAMSFDNEMTQAFVEVMKKLDSPYVGLVVDLGIFCRRHPRISTEYFLKMGVNPEIATYINGIFDRGSDPHKAFLNGFPEELTQLFKGPHDAFFAMMSGGYESSDYSILDEYMPYIKHIHGKFYEMTDDNEEYSIAYGEVIAYLKTKGYDGYIASEYEGQRFVLIDEIPDSLGAVKKHQAMMKRYIDQLEKDVNGNV